MRYAVLFMTLSLMVCARKETRAGETDRSRANHNVPRNRAAYVPTSRFCCDNFLSFNNLLSHLSLQKLWKMRALSAMARRDQKRTAAGQVDAERDSESISKFLTRELPPQKVKQADYLTNALLIAGARYDRYWARRNEWYEYTPRKNRMEKIVKLLDESAAHLCELDPISRDDLTSRLIPNEIEAFVGSLHFFSRQTSNLLKELQDSGRPRELAEERWILEVAGIYENAFGQPARVKDFKKSKFFRLLEVSRPQSFPQAGKLTLRQIDRAFSRKLEKNSSTRPRPSRLSKSTNDR
jgi:hypothetical protein